MVEEDVSLLYSLEEDGGSTMVDNKAKDLTGQDCSKGSLCRGEASCVRPRGRNFLPPRCFRVAGVGILADFGGTAGR